MANREPYPARQYFSALHARLRGLEQRYNPSKKDLYFDPLSHSDADLYPAIVALAEEGMQTVRQHDDYFVKHNLYADGMFWYELFEFISAAAYRIRIDNGQSEVPTELIDALILILARMTHYSAINGGDITLRNDEALGNTLLAFYDESRIQVLLALREKEPISIDWTLTRVAKLREEMKRKAVADPLEAKTRSTD